jgi:hypothetical protein
MKPIHDQLAVTRRMLEEQQRRLAEHGGHLDDYRVLAALAETQYHLTRTLDARAVKVDQDDDAPDNPDESRWFDFVDDVPVVEWASKDFQCPACGGPRFHIAGAPSPAEARPSDEKDWVLASLSADCQDCGFASSVGTAALSWHRERAGLAPHWDVAEWREANGVGP